MPPGFLGRESVCLINWCPLHYQVRTQDRDLLSEGRAQFFWMNYLFTESIILKARNKTSIKQRRPKHLLSVFLISVFTQGCKDDPSIVTEIDSYKRNLFFFFYKTHTACRLCTCRGGWSAKSSIESIIIRKSTLLGRFGMLSIRELTPSRSCGLHGCLQMSDSAGERQQWPSLRIKSSKEHLFFYSHYCEEAFIIIILFILAAFLDLQKNMFSDFCVYFLLLFSHKEFLKSV